MPDMNSNHSQKLVMFWRNALAKASNTRLKIKNLTLPLARIKRLMKVEEDVRMVASEVPIIFSLVSEIFVEELTVRSWIHTEESRRRILQKSDINAATKTSQMYDFLIHVVSSNGHYDMPQNKMLNTGVSNHQIYLEPSMKNINYTNYN